jgi:hypothetical protein
MRFAQLIEWIPAFTNPQSWRFADSFAGMTDSIGMAVYSNNAQQTTISFLTD